MALASRERDATEKGLGAIEAETIAIHNGVQLCRAPACASSGTCSLLNEPFSFKFLEEMGGKQVAFMNTLTLYDRQAILRRIARIISKMEARRPSVYSSPSEEWLALSVELCEIGLHLMDSDGI